MLYSLEVKEGHGMRLLIREIRLKRGMTLKELGEKVGRKPHSVWEYENHKTRIPASVLYDISQALGVSIGALCTDDLPPANDDPPPTPRAPVSMLPRRRASRAKY